MKTCPNCHTEKSASEFHKNRAEKDGLQVNCKSCRSLRSKLESSLEQARARNRKYRNSKKGGQTAKQYWATEEYKKKRVGYRNNEKGKATRQRSSRQQKLRFPERIRAAHAVQRAARAGKLPRIKTQKCIKCHAPARDYDHYLGYEREHWLDVQPVCRTCHIQIETTRKLESVGAQTRP